MAAESKASRQQRQHTMAAYATTPELAVPNAAWSFPFILLLFAIAVFPLVPATSDWWEHHHHKLLTGLALGTIVIAYYGFRGFGFHGQGPGLPTVRAVLHHAVLEDYLPFMVLLLSLYVISGGLQLLGDFRALPSVNTGFLALGALAASLIGTTGASMVLIRPLLQTNQQRKHVRHTVIFFIFLVSNIGGCLLPLGDPPLFLGYLRGVPFLWTLNLVTPWLVSILVLLAVYYVWDRIAFHRESPADIERDIQERSPIRLRGGINVLWLLGIVLSVALIVPGKTLPGTSLVVVDYLREAVMLLVTAFSLATTPRGLRREVQFTYGAIIEVACIFLGIFLTMQVPIEILQARGASLGLNSPAHFFWASGGLSSVLDNAPTYLVFFETAKALPLSEGARSVALLDGTTIAYNLLAAVSLGSVFMGANTYIGNGPNFMVRSIAEERGVKMPSFFGYMLYSGGVLIPLFSLLTCLFFRTVGP
jgi:Na+/H+ antiporter NhaD/arsenite permease-like protein